MVSNAYGKWDLKHKTRDKFSFNHNLRTFCPPRLTNFDFY